MLVLIPPGWTVTARTPVPRSSWRSESVKPAHRELGRAVGALVGHARQAEHARGVDDHPVVLFGQDGQEGAGPVDHPVEVDLPQPLVVVRVGVEHRRGDRDARVVEHRGQVRPVWQRGQPLAHLGRETALVRGVPHVEHPDQHGPGQRPRGLLEPGLVDVGDSHRRAKTRQPPGQAPPDARGRARDHHRPSGSGLTARPPSACVRAALRASWPSAPLRQCLSTALILRYACVPDRRYARVP